MRINNRIRDGTATLMDGHEFAKLTGENLSGALRSVIRPDALPDGMFYYNIADRTVRPALQTSHGLVNSNAVNIQQIVDERDGIGIGGVEAEFPEGRVGGLVQKIADAETVDAALAWLAEPIINNVEAFFDDYVRANAETRTELGLKAIITRSASARCCDWCADLEGVYDYRDAPEDIYRRHEFCRCSVTYQTERTTQNVWTKQSWQSSPEEIRRREEFGDDMRTGMTAQEREQVLATIERDRRVIDMQRELGYSRRSAQYIARR